MFILVLFCLININNWINLFIVLRMENSRLKLYFKDVILSGISGATAVVVQGFSVIWAENIVRKQRVTNQSIFQCASKMVRTHGVKSLFKGTFPLICYNSFARFGDVSINFIVLNFFKHHHSLKDTPLFIQSWFSWALATGYRVLITPLQVYANPNHYRSIKKHNRKYIFMRAYLKLVKPEIMALYSWFLVQNYLIEYTVREKYQEGYWRAGFKYVWIGFLSMVAYDCYRKVKNMIWVKSLPSKFWINRVCLRGMNGSIFCSTSRFIKEHIHQ